MDKIIRGGKSDSKAKNGPWVKGVVFIGLLISVFATLIMGGMLSNTMENNGGNTTDLLGSGSGSLAIHSVFAGLVLLSVLMHLVVNRKSISFTLKKMFEEK